jgi:hypothetical protein
VDRVFFAFFARGFDTVTEDGLLNLTDAFFSGIAPTTLSSTEQWFVVGECSWNAGENAQPHTVDVELISPDGVEPLEYERVPAHQEPWKLPTLADGRISPLIFVILVRATFREFGQYSAVLTVDGEQTMVLKLDVLQG